MTPRTKLATALALLTAELGWVALCIEFHRSVTSSLADGHGLGESLFLFFRFFTIITNVGIATLMTVTVARLLRKRAPPPAPFFNAGLIYILVTCVTYELMLRNQWKPEGLPFWTDATIHDVVPVLTLLFWLLFAPRDGARWRDALLGLVYPTAYFIMILIAGALGEGYPYSFFDVDALHYPAVFINGIGFLAAFYVLGLITTGLTKAWAGSDERKQPLLKGGHSPVV